ncbi:lecithin retinol acyltransferase family protein [Lysinibacillus sp. NPDC096418]|uniref:lecithin retinol acyltransferase family protein n=1 Tax=Lysinibacillus sp. NPDC096418 TaxID=3364138 RepID=UPI00380A967C
MKPWNFIGPTAVLLSRTTKNTLSKVNRVIEKQTTKVNPQLGNRVRNFNETVENVHDTVNNFFDANDPINVTKRVLNSSTNNFNLGDHLYVQRIGYTHHGIYIGNNTVIHYMRVEGVTFNSLKDFAQDAKVHKKNSPKKYSNAEIIVRARSRIGEKNYKLFDNNCENFARWCRDGRIQ